MPVNSNIDIQDVTPIYEHLETVYTVAGMTFDNEEDVPDLGSIKIVEEGAFNCNMYCCLSVDISKLNTIFTKAYIGNAFNVGSGSVCIVADTQRAFMYHTTTDTWYEWNN